MPPQAYALLEEIAHHGGLAARARRLAGPARTAPTTAQAAAGPEELFARQQFLEYAEAVLDFVWFEVRERLGQFRDGDDRGTTVDSQSPGSTHGTAVQVDLLWKEVSLHADAECGVIDREDADAMDPVADLPNDLVEFIEGRCFPQVPLPSGEAPPELPEDIAGDPPLVRVLPAIRGARKSCRLDYVAEGRHRPIKVQLGDRVVAVTRDVV